MNEQESLNRLEDKIDKLYAIISQHFIKTENRLSRIETIQKGLLWVGGLVGISGTGYLVQILILT